MGGEYHIGARSPRWFRDWFGEYSTSSFSVGRDICRHCGERLAMHHRGYLGLCHECWSDLLYYCYGVASRQIELHYERWGNGGRPDPLRVALYKMRRNIELGTFDLLCKVAIDGIPNTGLKKAQHAAVLKERKKERNRLYYIANKERLKAINAAWRAGHRDEYLGALKRWGEKNRQRRREYNRQYWIDNRERITAKRRAAK